jgi:uncharacterized protein (DUF488 family)
MRDATIKVATIGFTRTSAEDFFERLIAAGVRQVIDVRLHNSSQLAGFAKAGDLGYFLERLGGIDYRHEPLLAPTDTMLKAYRQDMSRWDAYAERFLDLLRERRVESLLKPDMLEGACLLCSEASAHHCHRRLVVDYLNERWGGSLIVTHL